MDFFSRLINKKNKETDCNPSTQYSLTASLIRKINEDDSENKAYLPVTEIAAKLQDNDVRNIALTGSYGAGKSSVLLTLQNDFKMYNYLSISLARLDCSDVIEKKERPEKTTTGNSAIPTTPSPTVEITYRDDNELNRLIEYSILQQLIYREKVSTIPHSRFKRIKHISDNRGLFFSLMLVFAIIPISVLFEPHFLRIESICNLLTCNSCWKLTWDTLSILYIGSMVVFIIKTLIINTYNSKLNKINLKNGEIDISENISVFNKHLDEIIYFFEATNYNVVILEDLDRFETSNIFLKLREVNHLLNNSKAIDRKIVFIYAVRDNLFKDKSRTKFFDYISTVIAIINPSNSSTQLQKALIKNKIKDVSDDVCNDLGIFIDDMRILKNIVNEFIQYRCKLDIDRLEPKKLLAMILYKNYYPEDFSSLHNQKGIVYSIIKNKKKYQNRALQDKQKEIENLTKEIEKIIDFKSTIRAKELRSLYVLEYVSRLNLTKFGYCNKNESYTPSEIINREELFNRLRNNEFDYYYCGYNNNSRISIKFETVEKDVDSQMTYLELSNQTPDRIIEIKKEIEEIRQEILDYRSIPLCDILSKYSAEDFYNDVDENHLIAYLLRSGYINEHYYDYISYFYEGMISASDREFILDVKIGRRKKYDFEINKPKAVLEQIPENSFSSGIMLNINLVEFIVENKNTYRNEWNWIKGYIRRENKFDFIESYYKNTTDQSNFFNDILFSWSDFFTEGVLKSKASKLINLEILLKYFNEIEIFQYDDNDFTTYLSGKFDFISSKLSIIGLKNIQTITSGLDIKYNSLTTKRDVPNELMQYVSKNKSYTLTNKNLTILLSFFNPSLAVGFIEASYSTIIESKNKILIDYVNQNLSNCIKDVFSDKSIHETEKNIISLIENRNIDLYIKKAYLSQQVVKIKYLDTSDLTTWNIAIELNILDASWRNIEMYISNMTESKLPSFLINFIIINSKKLSEQTICRLIDEGYIVELHIVLLGTNILPTTNYRDIIKSFDMQFSDFDFCLLEPIRVELLLESNMIEFNELSYTLIKEYFIDLTPLLLLQNMSEFITNIDSYPLSEITAKSLLNSTELIESEKIIIIQSLPVEMIRENIKLSDIIYQSINLINVLKIDNDHILAIMTGCNDQNRNLLVFVHRCLKSAYSEDFVKSGLEILGDDYKKIALQKGEVIKIVTTDIHKSLVVFLKQNDFILKQQTRKGMIYINPKI